MPTTTDLLSAANDYKQKQQAASTPAPSTATPAPVTAAPAASSASPDFWDTARDVASNVIGNVTDTLANQRGVLGIVGSIGQPILNTEGYQDKKEEREFNKAKREWTIKNFAQAYRLAENADRRADDANRRANETQIRAIRDSDYAHGRQKILDERNDNEWEANANVRESGRNAAVAQNEEAVEKIRQAKFIRYQESLNRNQQQLAKTYLNQNPNSRYLSLDETNQVLNDPTVQRMAEAASYIQEYMRVKDNPAELQEFKDFLMNQYRIEILRDEKTGIDYIVQGGKRLDFTTENANKYGELLMNQMNDSINKFAAFSEKGRWGNPLFKALKNPIWSIVNSAGSWGKATDNIMNFVKDLPEEDQYVMQVHQVLKDLYDPNVTDEETIAEAEFVLGQNQNAISMLEKLGYKFDPGKENLADGRIIDSKTGKVYSLPQFMSLMNERDKGMRAVEEYARNLNSVEGAKNLYAISRAFRAGAFGDLGDLGDLSGMGGIGGLGGSNAVGLSVGINALPENQRDALLGRNQSAQGSASNNGSDYFAQNAANPSALPGSDYFAQNVENSGYGVFVEPIAKIFERNGLPKEIALINAKSIIQHAKDNINDKNYSPLDFNEKILEKINARRKDIDPDSEEIKETGLERELYEMQKAAYEKDKALYDGIIKRLKMGVKDLPEYRNVKRDPGIPYLSGGGWDTDEGFVTGLTNFTNKKATQSGAMGISLSRDYYAAQFSYLKDWKSQLDDMEEQLEESEKKKTQKESVQDRFARRWVLPMNQKRSQTNAGNPATAKAR